MSRSYKIFLVNIGILVFSRHTTGQDHFIFDHSGIIRGDTTHKQIAIIFTGGDFADGGSHICKVLREKNIKAGFFFTGDFYRDPAKKELLHNLIQDGHYLGPHSDKHLLYAPWENRDSSLVTEPQFKADILANYHSMEPFGLKMEPPLLFIPPYEWYNELHVRWARDLGIRLFNFTPGTTSNADYTTPDMVNYRSSQAIYDKIVSYEQTDPHGMNGFILLIHIGTDPRRSDKFYLRLADLIGVFIEKGYDLVRIDELLQPAY